MRRTSPDLHNSRLQPLVFAPTKTQVLGQLLTRMAQSSVRDIGVAAVSTAYTGGPPVDMNVDRRREPLRGSSEIVAWARENSEFLQAMLFAVQPRSADREEDSRPRTGWAKALEPGSTQQAAILLRSSRDCWRLISISFT